MTSFHASITPVPAAAFLPAAPLLAVHDQIRVRPIDIADERPVDAEARESLLDRAFGPARFAKTCERLRAGRLPAAGLSLVARVSGLGGGADAGDIAGHDLVGTVRLWHVTAGGVPALMLGPLAVAERYRCERLGARLVEAAIARATSLDHGAILLVGDAPYYARFGFERRHTLGLRLPGPVEDARFLGLELKAGTLAAAAGMVKPSGAFDLAMRRRRPHSQARLRRVA